MKNSVIESLSVVVLKKLILKSSIWELYVIVQSWTFDRVLTAVRQNFKREWSWRKVSKRLESIVVARNRNSKYGSERPSWSSTSIMPSWSAMHLSHCPYSNLARIPKPRKLFYVEGSTPRPTLWHYGILNSYGSWILEAALGYTKILAVHIAVFSSSFVWS